MIFPGITEISEDGGTTFLAIFVDLFIYVCERLKIFF